MVHPIPESAGVNSQDRGSSPFPVHFPPGHFQYLENMPGHDLVEFQRRILGPVEWQGGPTGFLSCQIIEIIKLRSAWKGSAPLDKLLDSISKVRQSGLVNAKTYRHAALETDLSVHLCWKSDQPEQNGSSLGLHLARALKEFGLVDHSVWLEDKK